MENKIEKGTTRRNTFFCTNKDRFSQMDEVLEITPKEITVFGQKILGWLITMEASTIDKHIALEESLNGDIMFHDPE